VGTWFYRKHPELDRLVSNRQIVPTLEQVFDFFKQRPTNSEIVYVEMKADQAEDTYIDLAESVAQLVIAHQLHSRVVVVSFHLKALARMKTIDTSITTGALFEPRRNPVKTMRKHPMITAALECGAKQILIHRLIATRPLLALAAENNLLPVVWTVDSRKWMSRTADFGIHALITNNPGLMTTGI
jgi:glycerophosphoryl diester phosphodiesterase